MSRRTPYVGEGRRRPRRAPTTFGASHAVSPPPAPAGLGTPAGRTPSIASTRLPPVRGVSRPETSGTRSGPGADGPGVGAGHSSCPPPGILELGLANVRGLETLGAACHLELHLVTFRQTFEALRDDGAEVDEDVLAVLLRDEAEALRIVEPLDSTVCHTRTFPSVANPSYRIPVTRRRCPAKLEGKQKRRANWISARRVTRSYL